MSRGLLDLNFGQLLSNSLRSELSSNLFKIDTTYLKLEISIIMCALSLSRRSKVEFTSSSLSVEKY